MKRSFEAKLLVLILEVMFLVLVDLNWSPSMLEDIEEKQQEFMRLKIKGE